MKYSDYPNIAAYNPCLRGWPEGLPKTRENEDGYLRIDWIATEKAFDELKQKEKQDA